MSAKILAIDTSTEMCSVALMMGNTVYTRDAIAPRDHTKKILPMVDEVLKEAGVTLQELDALAYGRGPGSFTGVRIGIGIAQGLALGAELPMIGISTLAAMAQQAYRQTGATHVSAAIDARMSEVYWAQYQRQPNGDWKAIGDECVIAPGNLNQHITNNELCWTQVGTGWAAYSDEMSALSLTCEPSTILYPEAQDMVFLAKFALEQGQTVAVEDSSPVYLRDTVTWKKLPGRS
ncbi:MAG: tRNA (adenosine(37)-N6)-threonylcarbamoyltransferase complex dimerization subunit type 1 TsaB [Vibrio sp.]